jgi:flagellar protein FliJ
MAFHFKLETVLTVRKNVEEQVQLKLAREQMMLNNYQMHFENAMQERVKFSAEMEERKKKTMDGKNFLFFMESMRILELQMHILKNSIAGQQQVVENARQELAKAMKERKVIEVLRENDLLKYQHEERLKEQAESDEQALLRHGKGLMI